MAIISNNVSVQLQSTLHNFTVCDCVNHQSPLTSSTVQSFVFHTRTVWSAPQLATRGLRTQLPRPVTAPRCRLLAMVEAKATSGPCHHRTVCTAPRTKESKRKQQKCHRRSSMPSH